MPATIRTELHLICDRSSKWMIPCNELSLDDLHVQGKANRRKLLREAKDRGWMIRNDGLVLCPRRSGRRCERRLTY